MTDSMLPIIRQMHEAGSDRERARLLLAVPDMVLMKYRPVFEDACRRAAFDLGLAFIDWRRSTWHAVRDAEGRLPEQFDAVRQAFAAFALLTGDAGKADRPSGIVARPSAASGEAAASEGHPKR